jgi:hypothetical protein
MQKEGDAHETAPRSPWTILFGEDHDMPFHLRTWPLPLMAIQKDAVGHETEVRSFTFGLSG